MTSKFSACYDAHIDSQSSNRQIKEKMKNISRVILNDKEIKNFWIDETTQPNKDGDYVPTGQFQLSYSLRAGSRCTRHLQLADCQSAVLGTSLYVNSQKN